MKTSLVIASVLLAGVALEAAAFRIDNNAANQGENNYMQWSRHQQGNSEQNFDEHQNSEYQYNQKFNHNNENSDQYSQRLNRYNNNNNNENRDQYNQRLNQNNYDNFDFAEQQQRFNNQNQGPVIDQSAGLTRKMVEKIATIQKIAEDNSIAQRTNELFDSALSLNKNVIKLSEQNFVTFYNTTMKHLNNGQLEYLYVNPERDTVLAQYQFNQVETVGSFKSNVRGANAGYFTVAMNKVNCNATTGFDNNQHAVIRPAQYRYADVTLKTEDGVETRAFDDALEHTYMGALKNALSAEVSRSANRGMIAQMKKEIRKPATFGYSAAETKGKLFDMRWNEDDVSMEMSNVGIQNPEIVAEPLKLNTVTFYRKTENLYRMRYHFVLNNLQWTSPLTVESAGKRINIRSADFNIDEVNVFVTVDKPYGQQQRQQSCGQFNANVEVSGLRYNFNENVPSETVTKVENKFQRFMEHSLENYVQESLKQQLCHSNYNY